MGGLAGFAWVLGVTPSCSSHVKVCKLLVLSMGRVPPVIRSYGPNFLSPVNVFVIAENPILI